IWKLRQPSSLLPADLVAQVNNFTPYFYPKKIPAGYSLDKTKASFSGGVLIMPLTKTGSPTIVINEQQIPLTLSDEQVQQNSEKVAGTLGTASINSIEGRLVGTMVVSASNHRTLILLNASGDADKADLTALLQGLRSMKR